MNEPTPTRWRRVVGACVPGLAETAALAVLCNAALELGQLTGAEGYPWMQKTPSYALLFLLGTLVLWLLIGLVHAVVGRFSVTVAVAVTATAVVAVADYEKVRLRREPIYPSDWEFAYDAGFLTRMIGLRVVLLLVLGILVAAVAGVAALRVVRRRLERRASRRSPRPPAQSQRTRTVLRVASGTLCLVSLVHVAHFNSPGNAARAAYETFGASWRPWSQQRNYLGNGFVGGFLYNLGVPEMSRPAGYSAAQMNRVTARYAAAAERINRSRTPGGLDDVNVVMVLSESFSDPRALRGVRLDEDPIPFVHRLMRTTMAGRMLARNIGGGTANMEFEALTGMSLSNFPPQVRVPYQMLVPRYESFPSAVEWFERHGHRTVAMHPFTTEMYRRREVYRIFGFDDFIYDRRMHNRSRVGHHAYISDAAAFDELHRTITATREPVFVNLVTMQNHIPYAGRYDDPVTVTDAAGTVLDGVGQYARGLWHTDRALERLLDRLRRSREKTVVLFYGDHLPGNYPRSVLTANRNRTLHQTPFLVWANFGKPGGPQPTISPSHFMDLVLQRADAPVPPYFALLEELRAEVPAMDGGFMIDADDRRVDEAQLSPRATRVLDDYRMVQYDLSVGKRYSLRAMLGDPVPPAAGPR